MFIFAGHKCRSSESKRNLLPGARLLGEAIADYVTAKNKGTDILEYKKRRHKRHKQYDLHNIFQKFKLLIGNSI